MKKPNWQSHKRGAVPMHVYESAVTGFASYLNPNTNKPVHHQNNSAIR